jgi:thiol-disulfide isomerase/thioredoxin
MKLTRTQWALAIVTVLAVALTREGPTLSRAAELKIGDPAPKLQTGKWVQGEPVKEFEAGKAYIVEFWATWCGPCRVSIPHLNDIHLKFKDKGLVVIGQDCWERDESKVEPFVKEMGEKMTYRVALDDKSESKKGQMADTWMEAAGRNGIPSAFLVDTKGKIAWIGHPMQLEEKVIEQVLAGSYDLKKAAAEAELEQKNQAELTKLSRQLATNMKDKEWDKAEATLEELLKLVPERQRSGAESVRMNILLGKKDYDQASAIAMKMSEADLKNGGLQNQLAWTFATQKDLPKTALATAEKLAARAVAAEPDNPAILDTMARVHFMQGRKDKAMEMQEKAVQLAEGDSKAQYQETLDSYKNGKLPEAD